MNEAMRRAMMEKDLGVLRERGFDAARVTGKRKMMLDAWRGNVMQGEFDHIEDYIWPGKAAIDAGANVGHYSLKMAAFCAEVLAVEPVAELGWLAESLPDNCRFAACALGEETGEAELNIPLNDEGGDMHGVSSFTDLRQHGYDRFRKQITAVRRLDDVVAEVMPDVAIGFMKIDVEGWEVEVLLGASGIIETHRPNLQVEIWPHQMPEVAQAIEAMGYRGLFYFDHVLHSLSAFDHAIHTAPENDWDKEHPERFRPELHVNNFFFVPA